MALLLLNIMKYGILQFLLMNIWRNVYIYKKQINFYGQQANHNNFVPIFLI